MIASRYKSYGPIRKHVLNEFSTREIAQKYIKPGDTVLDLGANQGFHTTEFVKHVGPSGLVHAFEPNYELWPFLVSLKNVRLWPVAVGDAISVESFILPTSSTSHQVGSIVDPRDFLGPVDVKILSVPQVTLDSLKELQSSKISFMKIDIERREASCLRGARETIAKNQPVIVFENNTQETEELLNSMGYMVTTMIHPRIGISLANMLAVPQALGDDLERIYLSEEELTPMLDSIEAQFAEPAAV
jgi:FkbM family methyltransferase